MTQSATKTTEWFVDVIQFMKNNLFIILHLILLFLIFYNLAGLSRVFHFKPLNLLVWDSKWYLDIAKNGYWYMADSQSNVGFMPLFPYVWKLSGFNVTGISFANLCVFLLSAIMLGKCFGKDNWVVLIYLSLPSVVFFYIPYSEALFFLFGSLFLVGLRKQNRTLSVMGLFLASMTRGAFVFFLPAIIVMETVDSYGRSQEVSKSITNIALFSTATFLGGGAVGLVQWFQTDKFFPYFEAQRVHWGHQFSWPRLPFTGIDATATTWLNGIAFWFAVMACCILGSAAWKTVFKKIRPPRISKPLLFSTTFLFLTCVYSVLFNVTGDAFPSGKAGQGTVLFSLHRLVMATPFFFVFLIFLLDGLKPSCRGITYGILSSIGVWFLFGAYRPLGGLGSIQSILYFFSMTAYVSLFLLSGTDYRKISGPLLYVINLSIQGYVFFRLVVEERWVG
jgi:uncharacterized membrane protein YiaA